MDAAAGVKDILIAANVGVLAGSSGWSIHVSSEPETPDTTITVYNTGGLNPNPRYLLDYPSIQVRVRGAANGYLASRAKAQQIKDILLGINSQTIGPDRWDSVIMLGDINGIGNDETNRPIHTLNFQLIVEPGSGDNRVSL